MKNFIVPTKEQVSANNQEIFNNLEKMVGFVPNLYASFAYSENALGNYLTFQNGKSSLKAKEKEVVNLVVSQVNQCIYCLSAHTAIAKMNGFTDEQIIAIRKAEVDFDSKLSALAVLVKSIAENKGHADEAALTNFFEAGYDKGKLIDVLLVVGDKTITNYLHALTDIPVDWPAVPAI
ncbi:carboxymuconolactone decarboxylase family protein [Flavobacterium sp. C4GT6]|uniref:carboxymuconolactone decarboxylase family protein n=1 Tax=Flavobacterium sp. C4GT6 TaxID=3103818 RepID=UPI002ED156D4